MNLTRVIKNIFFLLICVFAGLTLVVTTAGVQSKAGEFTPFNDAADAAISHIRTPSLTEVMLSVTNIGSPFVLTMVALVLAIVLVLRRDTYDTLLYMVSITISIVSFIIMKNALGTARPVSEILETLSGWSFPSGHATVATAFFFVTGYSFFSWPKNWGTKITLVTFCIIGASLIAFSRVYLQAHFAVDVLAGIALGLIAVSFTILVFNVFLSEREWWRRRVRSL
jgi:membrane-associated phospholipid phosphatase